jgi:hypothetical protein
MYGAAYQPVEQQRVKRKSTIKQDKPLWHVKSSPGQMWKEKNAYISGVRITKYS